MRKLIASLLASYWAFIQKHPLISIFTSLILMGACAAGIYLIGLQLPTLLDFSCLTGGCPK